MEPACRRPAFRQVQPDEPEAHGSRRTEYDFPIVDKQRTWKILDVMAPIAKAHDVVLHVSRSHGSWQSPW